MRGKEQSCGAGRQVIKPVFAIETTKHGEGAWGEGGTETKRGGKSGAGVIRHDIRHNAREPSVIGAANCFHRELRGKDVPSELKGRGNTHKCLFCCACRQDMFASPPL